MGIIQDFSCGRYRAVCLQYPSCTIVEKLCLLLAEDRCNSGLGQVPYISHTLNKDPKKPLFDPEKGKQIPTQGDKPAADCVDYLSLDKEVFQAQGPFLHGEGELKD